MSPGRVCCLTDLTLESEDDEISALVESLLNTPEYRREVKIDIDVYEFDYFVVLRIALEEEDYSDVPKIVEAAREAVGDRWKEKGIVIEPAKAPLWAVAALVAAFSDAKFVAVYDENEYGAPVVASRDDVTRPGVKIIYLREKLWKGS